MEKETKMKAKFQYFSIKKVIVVNVFIINQHNFDNFKNLISAR